MMKFLQYVFLFLSSGTAVANTRDISEFKAVGDGKTLNTHAIQRTIDECAAAGGGEVRVPAGVFLTGTLQLKSNITLRLMPGSVIQGSKNPADYPDHDISAHRKFGTITHDGAFVKVMKSLIIADGLHNVSIVGEGAIRGAGEADAFQLGVNKDGKPKNLFFIGCQDVKLIGIRVFNSAQITLSISGCDRVHIEGIYVHSVANFNCDGIDVDAREVVISDCIVESEDDALCFKSEYLGRFCENVTVQNCVVASICNGLKLGTGSRSGFRNVTVSNCVIHRLNEKAALHAGHASMMPEIVSDQETPTVLTGIVILGVDGGLVENIRFSNIVMTDVLSPIFIRAGRRFLDPDGKPSAIRNVSIENVTANCRSLIPSIIAGLDDSPVRDVRLSDIRVTVPIGVTSSMLKEFPESPRENEKGYPENRLTFGIRLPASAFYIRHAEQISLRDVVVTTASDETRPAIQTDDVRGFRVRDFRLNDHPLGSASVRHIKSTGMEIHPKTP
jgi:polygalacturonase